MSIDIHSCVFENITWHVGSEVERRMNFVKHTHCFQVWQGAFCKRRLSQITKGVTLRWHFRRKCRCQLTFILVFQNVTRHVGSKVERRMNFVKHTHCFQVWQGAFCKRRLSQITKGVTLRWHFRRKCRCQLTFIIVFKNVMRHVGSEVERQLNFVKHTHCF